MERPLLALYVEDDEKLAASTIDFLETEGIEVCYASNAKQARAFVAQETFDVAILDMNLPDGNGIELAALFRDKYCNMPVLFLSAEDSIEKKLSAFGAGALDYLTKPFNLAELNVRLKLLQQKKANHKGDVINIDSLEIWPNERIVKRAGNSVTLSPQQWQLLTLLAEAHPEFVSKHKVIEIIWPDEDVSNDMYKALISRLRNNLNRNGEPNLLVAVKGQGLALRES